jgi:hypothetical protein
VRTKKTQRDPFAGYSIVVRREEWHAAAGTQSGARYEWFGGECETGSWFGLPSKLERVYDYIL